MTCTRPENTSFPGKARENSGANVVRATQGHRRDCCASIDLHEGKTLVEALGKERS